MYFTIFQHFGYQNQGNFAGLAPRLVVVTFPDPRKGRISSLNNFGAFEIFRFFSQTPLVTISGVDRGVIQASYECHTSVIRLVSEMGALPVTFRSF